ncbi:MAG: 50S ribosomal protein L30 [Acidobacteria bacterium]|nr:50S ribosomal protein L30 [Acidobacteriota bacterium]
MVLRSLGLRRIRHQVTQSDVPTIRGMINKIPHLVRIVEEESPPRGPERSDSKSGKGSPEPNRD